MRYWKNTSGSTFERGADGETPGWTAGPGDVVPSETNPAPGSFEETKTKPKATEAEEPKE